jgi:DNA-binding MarR family transcriptional regulator
LIVDYFNSTQVIRCENGHEFPYSEINEFRRFKMNCPVCMEGRVFSTCKVSMIFTDIKQKFLSQEESEKIKITFHEFLVLNFLRLSQSSISHQRLSSSLDIALPTIKNLIQKLIDNGWVEIDVSVSTTLKKDHVKITSKGVRIYEKIEKILGKIKSVQKPI